MAQTSAPSIPLVTSCNTCKLIFNSTDEVKAHYKEELHIVNSKRRAQNLPYITPVDFKILMRKKSIKSRSGTTSNSVVSSRASVKNSATKKGTTQQSDDNVSISSRNTVNSKRVLDSAKDDNIRSLIAKLGISDERADRIIDKALCDTVHEEAAGHDGASDISDEDNNDDEEGDTFALPIGPNISIFDNKEFSTSQECVDYMSLRFGFFVPDQEYLTDLDGLLTYLGEKVKLGGLCLFCQKQFTPGQPCMDHMTSKSHCKLRYEDGIDLEEFDDFYDYSAQYEDCDTDDEDVLQMTDAGDLILPNGKRLGHRMYKQFYKQYFAPEDTRPSIVAQRREDLLRVSTQLGLSTRDTNAISRMSDSEVMTVLTQQQKQLRKMKFAEQRAQQKYELRTLKTQEYQSTVDKLRSSATTTAKIRDYHSILM